MAMHFLEIYYDARASIHAARRAITIDEQSQLFMMRQTKARAHHTAKFSSVSFRARFHIKLALSTLVPNRPTTSRNETKAGALAISRKGSVSRATARDHMMYRSDVLLDV